MMGNSDSLTGQKILIVTDAWRQVNGVVTTLENLNRCLIDDGYDVDFLNSDDADYACDMPLYPEVKLAWVKDYVIKRKVSWADAVHIATPEGPIGFKTRNYCVKHNIPFTTGYHTKWPEFVRARLPVPQKLTYTLMRWLHKPSCCVLVPTESVRHELESHGMKNLTLWTRGVNRTQFSSRFRERSAHRSVPTLLCVSRVSHEKGLDDFCNLAYNGKKILVGDGPYLEELKRKYPDVEYTGVKTGRELAEYYANADVFVFPSKSDTFGVVMIESMACGTPVAAYPVTGPKDVVDHGVTGILHEDLAQAVEQCVLLNRKTVAQHSKKWSWRKCAQQFVNSLAWIYR
jgi:glycosyltransferase involved in cell wall biosynthesis